MVIEVWVYRYLTNTPDDGFDGWASTVIEAFSNEFYEANEVDK
jgi:hypothetical protein